MFKHILFLTFVFFSFSSISFAKSPSEELEQMLAKYKGNVIYLDFWASWCTPCRQSFPWMNEMQNKYNKLKIVSVNVDYERSLATKFLAETPANFSIIYDPKGILARKYKVQGMPSGYIFDKKGQLVGNHIGFTEAKKTKFEEEILHLLNQ